MNAALLRPVLPLWRLQKPVNERLRDASRQVDVAIGALSDWEVTHRFITCMAPGGVHQGMRKALSYNGVPRRLDFVDDFTNWVDAGNHCYGVIIHLMEVTGWPHDPLVYALEECNDCTLGDHLEAVMGLAWCLRNPWTESAAAMQRLQLPPHFLDSCVAESYAKLVDAAVMAVELFVLVRSETHQDTWRLSSRAMALELC